MKQKSVNGAGRPSKITPNLLEKLDEAFTFGHTDEEACLIVRIDPKTLYNYCDEHPDYSSRKELLKSSPKLIARQNIIKKLKEGNVELSRWYLERKARNEFNPRLEIDDEANIRQTEAMEETVRCLRAILERPQAEPKYNNANYNG